MASSGRELGRSAVWFVVLSLVGAGLLTAAAVSVEMLLPGPPNTHLNLRRGPIFSPRSFWYRPVGTHPPLARDSRSLVAGLAAQLASDGNQMAINTLSYSVPVYTVSRSQPVVHVTIRRCHGSYSTFARAPLSRVPIPPVAQPASGTDAVLVIWQPGRNREWEMWRATHRSGKWSACTGGEIKHVSSSEGIFPNPFGVSASGLSFLGGLIRPSELKAGAIHHVLAVGLPKITSGTQVWPADRNDGASRSSIAVPEGTRFRLSPAVNIASLHLSRVGRIVATALQRYGMVVEDTSGTAAMSAQDAAPLLRAGRKDPYVKLFAGLPRYKVLDGIPWNQMQALSPSYEKPQLPSHS